MSKNLFSLGVRSFTTLLSVSFGTLLAVCMVIIFAVQCVHIFNIQRYKVLLVVSFFAERLTSTNHSEQKVLPNLPRAKAFLNLCQLEAVFQWHSVLMT